MFETPAAGSEPSKDLHEIFDTKRTKLTATFVDRMERALRQADEAKADLRQIADDAKEAEFGPRDRRAMQKIARLRIDDKRGAAQEELAALKRVSVAVGFDLFGWADST